MSRTSFSAEYIERLRGQRDALYKSLRDVLEADNDLAKVAVHGSLADVLDVLNEQGALRKRARETLAWVTRTAPQQEVDFVRESREQEKQT